MTRFLAPAAIGAAMMFAVATHAASAQDAAQSAPPAPSPADRYLLSMLRQNLTLDRYLDNVRNQFRQADADRNGEVNADDSQLHVTIATANMRAMLAMMVFRADLDGDGVVTEQELRRMLAYDRRLNTAPQTTDRQHQDRIESEVRTLMQADTDRDGRITFTEALNQAKTRPEYMRGAGAFGDAAKRLLVLAPEGKSVVTLAEVEPRAEALFRTVDTDGNGTVSADELKAYRTRMNPPGAQARRDAEAAMQRREQARRVAESARARKEAELHAACAMPKASEGAKVVLLGVYQTEAVSTATIGSQDVAVGVGTVTVEPGSEPIYLVVTSFRPTIWRFYGATERIERLVLAGTMTGPGRGMPQEKPLVGETGIPAERVTFLGQSRCIGYFTDAPSGRSATAAGLVRREAGKEVAVIAARYAVSEIAVPSGRIMQTPRANAGKLVIVKEAGTLRIEGDSSGVIVRTGRGELESELSRFNPGGVVEIDPKRVVASQPVERYQVLPQQAGLLQLVRSGALVRNRSGEFLIKQKIRFPAELNGAHSVKFLLLRGVPMPDGDPGHSTVISEETGEKLLFERSRR